MTQVFRHGLDELKRRWHRRQLRKQLAGHDATRATLLGQLGRRAFEDGLDLSPHAALRDAIGQLNERAGGVAAQTKTLEAELAAQQDRRRAAEEKFNAEQAELQSKKNPVDAALTEARREQTTHETNARVLQARLDGLARELTTLRQPQPDADAAASAARIRAIESDQPRLAKELDTVKAMLPAVISTVSKHLAESQELAKQLATVAANRQQALRAIDAEISTTRSQQQSATNTAKDIDKARSARFVELGTAVYTASHIDSRLEPQAAAVRGEDERRAATQATFDASMAETQAMPPNTLRNFAGLTLLALLIVFGLPYASYSAWQSWSGSSATEGQSAGAPGAQPAAAPPVNPFLEHDLKNQAPYILANRLADARTEADARAALLDLFRNLGLGVYTPGGQQVLAGSERSWKDFYLYDFQLNILARTQIAPSYMEYFDFMHFLGKTVTKLEVPILLHALLSPAISNRYRSAVDAPADPKNFLILFLDGLARRQPEPYSLGAFAHNNTERLQISPVQSLLILMDFFMPPDPPKSVSARPWPTRFEPVAYAATRCDDPRTSDTAKKLWGLGYAALGEAAEESFFLDKLKIGSGKLHGRIEDVAAIIDSATVVIEAAADMLILFGLEVKVEATPYTIHLRHAPKDIDGSLKATVTFDPGIVHEDIINCGWLIGKQMPMKGPVPDVEVSWEFSRSLGPELMLHPKSDYTASGSVGLKGKTDSWGISYFPLMAANCPGSDKVAGKDYLAIASARIITTSIPTPTLIDEKRRPTIQALLPRLMLKFGPGFIEMFMGGRKGYTLFRAEWHEKPKTQYRKPGTEQ